MSQLLIICGPTATGKTKLAIELAKKFDGELVSADSRQVYRGMDIGTGKDLIPISNFKFQISKQFPNFKFQNKSLKFTFGTGRTGNYVAPVVKNRLRCACRNKFTTI